MSVEYESQYLHLNLPGVTAGLSEAATLRGRAGPVKKKNQELLQEKEEFLLEEEELVQ